ncbi:hypothetical protein SRED_002282 [Spiroplasma melliferum]|uniref:Uncharacterized protein n=1 Tax=Spiroplasma melliferum TaxID=2134 RepID=A0ABX5UD19_SPIME|nr:hypothetical protein [Spiroplasma melliferum]QCO23428.1 hypothetical protein SRED_001897 [Spiroplasma melliferum]QCO23808.1 hypothetical protein SRED_002282 [Spiroplasma melliferum]
MSVVKTYFYNHISSPKGIALCVLCNRILIDEDIEICFLNNCGDTNLEYQKEYCDNCHWIFHQKLRERKK